MLSPRRSRPEKLTARVQAENSGQDRSDGGSAAPQGSGPELQDILDSQRRVEAGIMSLYHALSALRDDISHHSFRNGHSNGNGNGNGNAHGDQYGDGHYKEDSRYTAHSTSEEMPQFPRIADGTFGWHGRSLSQERGRFLVHDTSSVDARDTDHDGGAAEGNGAGDGRSSQRQTRIGPKSSEGHEHVKSPLLRIGHTLSAVDSAGLRSVAHDLPLNWPTSIKPRDYGSEATERVRHTDMFSSMSLVHPSESSRGEVSSIAEQNEQSGAVMALFTIIGFLVLLHDFSMLPFALAWQVDFEGYFKVASIVSVSFWMLDLSNSLRGGWRRYLRTWFLPDMLMVCSDWTWFIWESSAKGGGGPTSRVQLLRFTKLVRLLRIAGVFRVLRILGRGQEVFEQVLSDTIRVVLRILLLAIGTLWWAHMIACGWFALGMFAKSDTGNHWIEAEIPSNGEMVPFYTSSLGYQYLTSMHWAVQQLALAGAVDLPCTNSAERLFAVIWLTFGMMFGSLLVSSLSANMVEVASLRRERDQKLRGLRRYLRQNPVDHGIAMRVLRQVTERLQQRAAAGEATVPALDLLSNGLRAQLHGSICRPVLLPHPLMRLWSGMDPTWFDRFCMEAVKIMYFREADELFCAGTPATHASIVCSGRLAYALSPALASHEARQDSAGREQEVVPGGWICEGALWCQWVHVGTASSVGVSKLVMLEAAKFAELCRNHRLIAGMAIEVCKQFHRRVLGAKPPFTAWPNDVHVPSTDFAELVASMTKHVKRSIGAHSIRHCRLESQDHNGPAVAQMRRKWKLHEQLRMELLNEVLQGTSTVVLDGHGRLARIVSVVAVKLQNEEGCLFVQLGKRDLEGIVTASCDLPGAKRKENEVDEGALQRILRTKLAVFQERIQLNQKESTCAERASGQYEVQTKYIRTVFCASYDGPCDLPRCTMPSEASAPMASARSYQRPSVNLHDNSLAIHGDWRGFASPGRSVEHGRSDIDFRVLPERLLRGEVFYVRQRDSGTFYAWLLQSDFEQLQRPGVAPSLEAWLVSLGLPETPEAPKERPDQEDEDWKVRRIVV